MWKPGTEKPKNAGSFLSRSHEKKKKKKKGSRSKEDRPNFDLSVGDVRDTSPSLNSSTPPSSATPRKRLSGGTMNMRFMKRRKSESDTNSNEKSTHNSHSKPSPRERIQQSNDAMDIESDNDSGVENDFRDGSKYGTASSVDMYGIEASLMGRRSFRGFNQPIERIYKDSKARLENRGLNDRPGKKVSDEELLQRYKDIARERGGSGGARGIGNFDKKNKNKKRR